ncbi:GDP-mannose 4,6-dehydratase [Nodosilinea sp. LEGE 07298]|uniref:GDP-mannose 4,6-dehydratase n=1 Tax=Nodosilinea sp. LEGE 07298 TaxID=2777970 RepID=UPI00187F35FB|nr:GDP-mannose 4,6-dehydratase [Nodosilinea sp. LEGE 07298]MBE9109571.1 GDP-mannose 4,6-dehydratase [Nodosilinea sp. LEGE 07298]
MKRALITGISGQDGSYLAELLLAKGYDVHGLVRRASIEDASRQLAKLGPLQEQITFHPAALENELSLYKLIAKVKPDECYHLAASSFVSYSFEEESSILTTNFSGTHFLLASLKEAVPDCRFFFAGSSEMFGTVDAAPQNEATPFNPRSIYGISKLASHHLVRNYRNQYGLFACTGILYNHESPRRDFKFVTRKITAQAARIKMGLDDTLYLGNLDALRDWGYAPDYVQGIWQMLQHDVPDDYVIASGVNHSVQEFVNCAFSHLGLDYRAYVKVDPRFYRPAEEVPLRGDASKIRQILGWQPTKPFEAIVAEMVDHDLSLLT